MLQLCAVDYCQILPRRFFMDKVAKHLFLFEGDGVVRDFQGTFTEYLEYRRDYMKPGVSRTSHRGHWGRGGRGWGLLFAVG